MVCARNAATPTSQSARNSPKQIIRGTSSARGTPSLTPRLTPTGSPKPQPKKGSPLPSSYTLDSQHIQIPTSQPTSRSSSPPSSGSGQCEASPLCFRLMLGTWNTVMYRSTAICWCTIVESWLFMLTTLVATFCDSTHYSTWWQGVLPSS